MFLHDERRRSQIDEQHAHGEAVLQGMAEEGAVVQHLPEIAPHVAPPGRFPTRFRERFAESERSEQQDASEEQQEPEDAVPPVPVFRQDTAADGRQNRGHAVHGAYEGQHPREFADGIAIGGDRPREDDASGRGQPLNEPEGDEVEDGSGQQTARRGQHEQPERRQQRRSPAVFVADRAEEQLSRGQTDRARGQAQLHHRRGGSEKLREHGKRRQVHVHDERPESAQYAQVEQQE